MRRKAACVGAEWLAFQRQAAPVFGFCLIVAAGGDVIPLQIAGKEHRLRFDRSQLLAQCHSFVEMTRGEDQAHVRVRVLVGQRPAFHDFPGNGDGFGPLAFAPQAVGAFAFHAPVVRRQLGDACADLFDFGAQLRGLRAIDPAGKLLQ